MRHAHIGRGRASENMLTIVTGGHACAGGSRAAIGIPVWHAVVLMGIICRRSFTSSIFAVRRRAYEVREGIGALPIMPRVFSV